MRFVNPLPFVRDMARAKGFYRDVLSLTVVADHGDFVQFEDGFALHDGASLLRTIFGEADVPAEGFGRRNLVLYFEVDDIEDALGRVRAHVELIHPLRREPWGQRVCRFHDPDGHHDCFRHAPRPRHRLPRRT